MSTIVIILCLLLVSCASPVPTVTLTIIDGGVSLYEPEAHVMVKCGENVCLR